MRRSHRFYAAVASGFGISLVRRGSYRLVASVPASQDATLAFGIAWRS